MSLTFEEYQKKTDDTAVYTARIEHLLTKLGLIKEQEPFLSISSILKLQYAVLGLGESGEVQNKVKKIIRDNQGERDLTTITAVMLEVGDLLYYCARVATELGFSLEECAEDNLDRIVSRYARDIISSTGEP